MNLSEIRSKLYDWLAPKAEPNPVCRLIECVYHMNDDQLAESDDYIRAVRNAKLLESMKSQAE